MPDFACKLKQLRTNRKITQSELASELNVSQNAIFNWENGKREPSIDMIKKISGFFGVSTDFLIGRENRREHMTVDLFGGVGKLVPAPGNKKYMQEELTEVEPCSDDNINNHYTISVDIDTEHPFYILQEKIKRGESLTPEESALFREYMQKGFDSLKQSMNKLGKVIEANYKLLNEEGQKKADEQIDRAIEQIELLTKIPEYQKKSLENYAEFVSDKTPEYWTAFKNTLENIGDHKDSSDLGD